MENANTEPRGRRLLKGLAPLLAAALCCTSTSFTAYAQAGAGRDTGVGAGNDIPPAMAPGASAPRPRDAMPEMAPDQQFPAQPDAAMDSQPPARMDEYAERSQRNDTRGDLEDRRPPLEWKDDLAERHNEV